MRFLLKNRIKITER